jgi:hypothetical protein
MKASIASLCLAIACAFAATPAYPQATNLLCLEPVKVPGTAELYEVIELGSGNLLLHFDTGVFLQRPSERSATLLIADHPLQGPQQPGERAAPVGFGPIDEGTKGVLASLNDGLFEINTVSLEVTPVPNGPGGVVGFRRGSDGAALIYTDDKVWSYHYNTNVLEEGVVDPITRSMIYREIGSGRVDGLFYSRSEGGDLFALVDNSLELLATPIERLSVSGAVGTGVILIQAVSGVPMEIDTETLAVGSVRGLPRGQTRPFLEIYSSVFALFTLDFEVYIYSATDRAAVKVEGISGVEHVQQLDDTHALVSTGEQTFVLAADGSVVPSTLPVASFDWGETPPGSYVYLSSELGMFRLNVEDGVATPIRVDAAGEKVSVVLEDGSLLLGTEDGILFRFAQGAASPQTLSNFGRAIEDIIVPTGSISPLVLSGGQYFAIDLSGASEPRPVGPGDYSDDTIYTLPEGNIAIDRFRVGMVKSSFGTWNDLRMTPVFDAGSLRPGLGAPIELAFRLEGPCADEIANLDLILDVSKDGSTPRPQEFRLDPRNETGDARIQLMSSVLLDEPGTWRLQLSQNGTPVGNHVDLPISDASFLEWLQAFWKQILIVYGILEYLIIAVLIVAAHWNMAAFAILSDEGLARLVTWPFFFLRHVPFVQRWVLAPWFKARARAVKRELDFLDPPVSGTDNAVTTGSTLLSRLTTSHRIWLSGRSGMGKSALFYAWERDYFPADPAASLAESHKRFRFTLITIPVRYYADRSIPQQNPETWVLEAVQRRLEEFGLVTKTPLVDAMLRSGDFALAFDGTNEADCEDALEAFGRQYPRTRIIATSQGRALPGWEVWRLPETIESLKSELLELWLPGQGTALANRLAAPAIAGILVSGYDLRLIADIAKSDPLNAPLPANRVGLYKAILTRANGIYPFALSQLAKLAWEMMVSYRREIQTSDEAALGTGVLDHLADEDVRVVRKLGLTFEFRHDLMRAFLAAAWLAEELPSVPAITAAMDETNVFDLPRRDQADLWSFLALLIGKDDDLAALWLYAIEKADQRGILTAHLQEEADRRGMELRRTAPVRPLESVTV